MAGPLKHLVFLGNIPRRSPQIVNYYVVAFLARQGPLGIGCTTTQRAPGLKKSISRGNIEKISFQYGMTFSIENEIFIPGPSLAAEKQGLGLKISIENENFKPRMKISSENENFVRGQGVIRQHTHTHF